MIRKILMIVMIAIFSYACNNSGNDKNSNKDSVAGMQNSESNSATPDISGVYRLPEKNCDIVITFIKESNNFKYHIKGKNIDAEGFALVTNESDGCYVTFDGPTTGNNKPKSRQGLYKDNTLSIQNYGNAMNQYTFFEDCPDKFLEFKKSSGKNYNGNTEDTEPKYDLPDLAGNYKLPANGCDLKLTIKKVKSQFEYFFKGMGGIIDMSGNIIFSKEEDSYRLTFDGRIENNEPGSVQALFKENTITIQNSGNAQNQFTIFSDCGEKYLEFSK